MCIWNLLKIDYLAWIIVTQALRFHHKLMRNSCPTATTRPLDKNILLQPPSMVILGVTLQQIHDVPRIRMTSAKMISIPDHLKWKNFGTHTDDFSQYFCEKSSSGSNWSCGTIGTPYITLFQHWGDGNIDFLVFWPLFVRFPGIGPVGKWTK